MDLLACANIRSAVPFAVADAYYVGPTSRQAQAELELERVGLLSRAR